MSREKTGSSRWRLTSAIVLALGIGGSFAPMAQAQEAGPDDGDIIVTATRRSTALQDVPIAVTPLTGAQLENSGVRDIQDLTSIAPALQFNVSESESSATARLRGIGTQGSNPGLESSVGIFVDGVYRARNGVALSDLGEVRQVEVLRGPQGTLFGRNTSAGLITITTEGPDLEEAEFRGEATYGSFNETRVAASASIPLIENTLGARIFAARSTRDGFLDVVDFNGDTSDSNTRDMWTVRGQVLFAPTPSFEVRFIADYSERDEECCAAAPFDPELVNDTNIIFPVSNIGAPSSDPALPSSPGSAGAVAIMGGYGAGAGNQAANIANLGSGRIGDRRGFANREYGQIIQDQGFSAEVIWDLGFAELTSVTAYRDWVNDTGGDIDFTAADLWYRQDDGSAGFGFEVFTQEFRLAGTTGPVDWLVGMFYSDETLERRDKITLGPDFNNFWRVNSAAIWAVFDPVVGPANDPIDTALDNAFLQDRYEQTGNSLALFTHEIIELSPSTRLSVGLRYTSEEKDLTAQFSNTFQGPAFNGGRQFLYANRATIAGGAFNGVLTAAGEAGACNDFTSTGAGTFGLSISQLVYCTAGLNTALNGPVWSQSREENEFSGVLALQHEFSDDVSAYISASRGYKAGGFNLDRNFDGYVQTGPATYTIAYNTGFEPEMVDAYELGVKSAFFNRTLLANLAIFHNDYENFQLNTFNGISFQLTTIPEVISKGVELDLTWRTPIDGLTFQGGVAHTLARYGEDTGWVADSYNPYNRTLVLGRLPGEQLTNSPDWTVTGAATYERDLGGLSGLAYLDFRWMDDQVTGSDLNPAKLQPAYILVNARLGLYTQDERIGVELWARNLLDETAMQVSFDTPLQSGRPEPYARNYSAFLNDPRTVGITLRARY